LVEIVHPVEICGDEHVGRRAGFDLLGERIAGGIGHDDPVARARLELPRLFVQSFLKACGGEYRYVGRFGRDRHGDRERRKNNGDKHEAKPAHGATPGATAIGR
jgi:hypothetical protein